MEHHKLLTSGRHHVSPTSVYVFRKATLDRLTAAYADGQASESYGVPSYENPWEGKDQWARAAWLIGYQSHGYEFTFEVLRARVRVASHEQVVSGRIASRALVDAIEDAREVEAARKAVAA